MQEGTPLVSKQALLRRPVPELERFRARLITGTVCGIAVIALLRLETGGLMHFVDEESAGLAAGSGFQMESKPVQLLGKCVSGDCVDGIGVYEWDSGEVYSGPFKHRRMHGKNAKYTWHDIPNNTTYEYVGNFDHGEMPKGCVAGDCSGFPAASRGVYIWPNGEEYVGEWRSGLMEGDGTYRWPDGEKYVGEWREGKRYGEGIATYAPGTNPSPFYDGNWEYDEPVEVYPNSIHAGH